MLKEIFPMFSSFVQRITTRPARSLYVGLFLIFSYVLYKVSSDGHGFIDGLFQISLLSLLGIHLLYWQHIYNTLATDKYFLRRMFAWLIYAVGMYLGLDNPWIQENINHVVYAFLMYIPLLFILKMPAELDGIVIITFIIFAFMAQVYNDPEMSEIFSLGAFLTTAFFIAGKISQNLSLSRA